MKHPASLWSRISQLFDEGSGLPASERAAWLQTLDRTEPDCASFVRSMLEAADAPTWPDRLGGVRVSALSAAVRGTELVAGTPLGPYRLIEALGEGGMASVWLAEQTAGVLRRVALKIPHVGLEEGRAAARRFAQERDFLAALEHPNIARLYDAGVTEGGVSYLAMELISGVPITAYCEGRQLTVGARLALFDQVLAAVGHAHAHLVIHRDLKAGNILVTADGQVKLLDFGIAGLLNDEAVREAAGGPESRVLTPDTASPEQLAGQPLTTAADVYSLGVVLYELLAGQRPYRLDPNAPDLALQRSAQVLRLPSDVARERSSSGWRALTGDLDAIVAKALQPQPAQRYAGVGDLARDLQRHAA